MIFQSLPTDLDIILQKGKIYFEDALRSAEKKFKYLNSPLFVQEVHITRRARTFCDSLKTSPDRTKEY